MLKHIIKREILDNLLSLRFSLTLILMVVIMAANAFLFISDHREARSAYEISLKENREKLKGMFESSRMPGTLWRVMSFSRQWVYRKPSDFTFLADGHDKDLPNAFEVSAFEAIGPDTKLRTNPLLQTYESLDWALVIGVIMSFAAIVLTFDAISGDREQGTLKLSMSNAIPRATILLGKYIGALVSLLVPLLAGILLNVIIIAVSAIVPLDGTAWTRIGVLSLSSMLYVAGFVSLGIFVSSITRESATSLIVLLLSWAMLVIVIPGVGGIITSRMVDIPSFEQVNMNSWAAAHRAREEYLNRHPEMRGIAFGSGWWSPRENLAGPMARFEARNDVWRQYGDKMIRQVRIGQNVTRVSPLGIYRHAAETLAGTGVNHYDSFAKQVRRYREFLKGILMDRYPLNQHEDYGRSKDLSEKFMKAMAEVQFELSDVPEFHEEPIAVEAAAKTFIWDIFFLFMFLLFFLMGSVMAFLKYDVR